MQVANCCYKGGTDTRRFELDCVCKPKQRSEPQSKRGLPGSLDNSRFNAVHVQHLSPGLEEYKWYIHGVLKYINRTQFGLIWSHRMCLSVSVCVLARGTLSATPGGTSGGEERPSPRTVAAWAAFVEISSAFSESERRFPPWGFVWRSVGMLNPFWNCRPQLSIVYVRQGPSRHCLRTCNLRFHVEASLDRKGWSRFRQTTDLLELVSRASFLKASLWAPKAGRLRGCGTYGTLGNLGVLRPRQAV